MYFCMGLLLPHHKFSNFLHFLITSNSILLKNQCILYSNLITSLDPGLVTTHTFNMCTCSAATCLGGRRQRRSLSINDRVSWRAVGIYSTTEGGLIVRTSLGGCGCTTLRLKTIKRPRSTSPTGEESIHLHKPMSCNTECSNAGGQ